MKPPVHQLIARALENESVLDAYIAHRLLDPDQPLPPFKQLKLDALRRRLGAAFKPSVGLATATAPIMSLLSWPLAFVLKPFLRKHRLRDAPIALNWFEKDLDLILSAVPHDSCPSTVSRSEALSLLSFRDLASGFAVHMRVLKELARTGRGSGLRVHPLYAYNLFDLVLGSIFMEHNPHNVFVTANILQHRSYLMGHLASRCWIVQHGEPGFREVRLPHPFASIEEIFLLREDDASKFKPHFGAERFSVQNQKTFAANPLGMPSVLLASSHPTIDTELAFCREYAQRDLPPLAIKLHPRHVYDRRKHELLSFADHAVPAADDLDCTVFVSVFSAYQTHYESANRPCVRIGDLKNLDEAFSQLISMLEASGQS